MPTLEFEGKAFVYSHHLSVPYRELVPVPEKGIGEPSLDGNLVIHGDNLEALKALLPRYAGKVDVVYIDPPYNTGKEGWAYNDKVNSSLMKAWLGKVVDREDLQRHDKWLCMMWPRLDLLLELLTERGILLASIDDNELCHLRIALDQICGEGNWVGTIIWKNATDNNPTQIAVEHEYIVVFAKNKSLLDPAWKSRASAVRDLLIEKGRALAEEYQNDEDLSEAYRTWHKENKSELWPLDRYRYIDRGGIYTGSQSVHNPGREGYRYDVIHPGTKKPTKQPLLGYRFPQATMLRLLDEQRILFGDDENKIVEIKLYASEYEAKLPSVMELDGRLGAYDLKALFPDVVQAFKNPKPVQLIEDLLTYVTDEHSLVLDSFAGSGTTAQAVMEANKRDGGRRRFILVETEEYADRLTGERVRRVMHGVPASEGEPAREGLGGTFTYCELGEPMDTERFFAAGAAPAYEQVARYVVYTATGETAAAPAEPAADWFVAEAGGRRVHVIYRSDLTFLRSNASALTLDLAREIAAAAKGGPTLVFGGAQFVNSRTLRELGITFAQLPWSVHQRLAETDAGARA